MLTLGWKLLTRNLLLSLITAFQLMLSLFFCNVAIGYQNCVAAVNGPLSAFSDGAYYYQSMFRDERAQEIEEKLPSSWRMEFLCSPWETEAGDALFYVGKETAERFRGQLKEGVWCTEAALNDSAIPCVTPGKKYGPGDTFAVSAPNGEQLTLRVVGRTGECFTLLNAAVSATDPTSDYISLTVRADGKSAGIIVCDTRLKAPGAEGRNAVVFPPDGAEQAEIDAVSERLKEEGRLHSFAEIFRLTEETFSPLYALIMPISVCFTAAAFLSAVAMSALNIIRNRELLSVYFRTGVGAAAVAGIAFSFALALFLIVLAEAALLLFLAQGAGILMIDDCVFDWKNLLLTAGFFLALAAVNILFSVLQYRKIAGGKQQ